MQKLYYFVIYGNFWAFAVFLGVGWGCSIIHMISCCMAPFGPGFLCQIYACRYENRSECVTHILSCVVAYHVSSKEKYLSSIAEKVTKLHAFEKYDRSLNRVGKCKMSFLSILNKQKSMSMYTYIQIRLFTHKDSPSISSCFHY